MLKPRPLKRGWLHIWLTALLFVSNEQSYAWADGTDTVMADRFDGRALVLKIGKSEYFFEAPLALSVADQGSTTPKIGLVHSGYTVTDPDGKLAMLTVTLQLSKGILVNSEKDALLREGALSVSPQYSMSLSDRVELDLTLPDDQAEETRLRSQLGFPKQIIGKNSSIPIQLQWKDVDGKTLYGWLTSASGLKFTIHYTSTVSGKPTSEYILSQDILKSWWTNRYGAALTIHSPEGVLPIAFDILSFATLLSANASMTTLTSDDLFRLTRVAQILQSISIAQPDQSIDLARNAFLSALWAPVADTTIQFPISPRTSDQPSALLSAHPELVKDLSGSGIGIDALIHN